MTPGSNDSRINRSSVAKQPTTIPAWDAPDELWAETVTCIRTMFAPFSVEITETDPGTTPHIEAVFGGTPELLGASPTSAGIAPLSKTCGVVENAMVYTFTDAVAQDAHIVCETMSQEIAHAYGLDHALLDSDPMSYLRATGRVRFRDEAAPCGELTARQCGHGPSACRVEQNSYAILTERLGASGWVPPPDTEEEEEMTLAEAPADVGCSAGGGGGGLGGALVVLLTVSRRHSRT